MSRSGYNEDCDSNYLYLYRGMIERTIKGKRSQAFLKELANVLDAMPDKKLIAHELISEAGEVCAIGAVCKARGIDVQDVDVDDRDAVGNLVDISGSLAAEIEYMNDEAAYRSTETPEERWVRIREWVASNLTPSYDGEKGRK
jgi:hypothetical protein